MATYTEILSDRDTAGARYVAAVAEFKASYIELSSIDRALVNATVQPTVLDTHGTVPVLAGQTFGPMPDVIPLRHPKYLPNLAGNWVAEVITATNDIVAGFEVE